jgi:hypothetical protein
MLTAEFCSLVGLMKAYMDRNPVDGAERIRIFFEDDQVLLSTDDVAKLTGWSNGHVIRLCKQGLLPHIPGNPHKFMIRPLMLALEQLQVGGIYGRRKATRKKPTAK